LAPALVGSKAVDPVFQTGPVPFPLLVIQSQDPSLDLPSGPSSFQPEEIFEMKKLRNIGVAVAAAASIGCVGISALSAAERTANSQKLLAKELAPLSGGQRFLVKYRAGTSELNSTAVLNQGLSAALSRAALDRPVAAGVGSSSRAAVKAGLLRRTALPGWRLVSTTRMLDALEAEKFLRELRANPAVETARIEQIYHHMGVAKRAMTPQDPDYGRLQWNFSNAVSGVRAEQAWDISQGEAVVVAIVDTGIIEGTPDLQGNVLPGYDMITDKRASRRNSDERVPGGWDLGNWVDENYCLGWATSRPHLAEGTTWHGTHVAGTVAQETNNNIGVAGLAHKAKVMPLRVLGSCGGWDGDIADAVVWAAGGEVPGLPINPNPAEIINLSLGSSEESECSPMLQDAFDMANSKGSIIVVAAGNDSKDASLYTMSSCKNVISVGATGVNGGRATRYSNYGSRIDISAPGGNAENDFQGWIWQMYNGGTEGPTSEWFVEGIVGTSMASPHVAAAAAMVQSVVETPLNWAQMRDLLMETATPFPVAVPVSTPMGAGILNVEAALLKATTPPCEPSQQQCEIDATPLANKVTRAGLAGEKGSVQIFSFKAQAGQVLSFITFGGTGDVSLFASFDREPQPGQADAFSVRAGNNETVRFTAPKQGTYYLKVIGVSAYAGLSLTARQ